MAEMIVVEDRNQDDLSRKAGCYLHVDTELWLEEDRVHRGDGPAVIAPDGAERWYIHGKEVSRDVNAFLFPKQMVDATRPRHAAEDHRFSGPFSEVTAD
ncbi:MAG: hypothetical protein AB7O86_09755 [Porticoccaceae bacterium]